METKDKQVEAQGAKAKKEQVKSVTYALKAIGEHFKTLKDQGFVTGEEEGQIAVILESAGSKYLKKLWK